MALANPEDLAAADVPNAYLVRNGYPMPSHLNLDARFSRSPRVILFVGLMTYGPNAAAARTLARVAARLAEHSPDLELRIVGEHGGALGDVAATEHVTVVGKVANLEPELERADVVMTPIPYGGGTRLKLLEAMAHGIPVVSTTVGAAGLGLVPERHFLRAENEEELVQAWQGLLRAWGPRVAQMVTDAFDHVRERFSFAEVCRDVEMVLAAVQ
jgi:glycosyltransferase involved in cell wall biosynthesis